MNLCIQNNDPNNNNNTLNSTLSTKSRYSSRTSRLVYRDAKFTLEENDSIDHLSPIFSRIRKTKDAENDSINTIYSKNQNRTSNDNYILIFVYLFKGYLTWF
jgi:hypothetical protein